jgi:hypothetical protein
MNDPYDFRFGICAKIDRANKISQINCFIIVFVRAVREVSG